MTVHDVAKRSFDDTIRLYNEAFESRDIDTFITFFRDDAIKIDPDGTYVQGTAAIAELFGGLFQMEFTATFPELSRVITGPTALQVTEITLTFDGFAEHFYTALTFAQGSDGLWRVLAAVSATVPAGDGSA
ncbi:YybH family protein [Aeromicrobium sp. CF3.5]|uniref:YybH family protein n=1 Tax=Aeromicrobium sp. CF3.5 TaxID=3373078 RepID=UPI003EE4B35E